MKEEFAKMRNLETWNYEKIDFSKIKIRKNENFEQMENFAKIENFEKT